jgi:hypothetical protein
MEIPFVPTKKKEKRMGRNGKDKVPTELLTASS